MRLAALDALCADVTCAQANGPLGVDDVGVVVESTAHGAVSVCRLRPCDGGDCAYPAAALALATAFPAAGGELGAGTVVRLAPGYSAIGDAESGPLAFADVGLVTSGRGIARVVRLVPAGDPLPVPRAALLPAMPPAERNAPAAPLREGDFVRASDAGRAAGVLADGDVAVVVTPDIGGDTVYVRLMERDVASWSYRPEALERAPRLEPERESAEPPAPPVLRVGQFARLAPDATRIRAEGASEPHEDDSVEAADGEASAWLRPGETAIVLSVRGRRNPVFARRIGDSCRGCMYAPGALVPAPPPPPLAAGDAVVLCAEYTGPLPSLARGPRLERDHVGSVVAVCGPATQRRLRVAAPDGSVRTYRAPALERAQKPRPVAPAATPPNAVLLPVHGHPIGARADIWPTMNRYEGSCDLCGFPAPHASAARCTAGCGFDVCAACLRTLITSAPGGEAVAAAMALGAAASQVTSAQLLAVAGSPAPQPAAAQPAAAVAAPQPQPPAAPVAAPARPAGAWSFIDGPAMCEPMESPDAPALAVAKLRASIAACALHGAAPSPDLEEDDGGAVAMEFSDTESEQELESEGEGDAEGGLGAARPMRVYRDALVESSMAALGPIGGDAWRRPTRVTFCATAGVAPEDGADGGGLTREWYSCTARALMELPVICPTDNDAREYYFNPARCSASDLAACSFLGAFLGRALLDGSVRSRAARLRHVTLAGVRLCDTFYKVLLGLPLTLADVAHVSAAEYRSLRAIHDGQVTPDMCLGTFEHAIYAPGAPPGAPPVAVLPLRPGGSHLPVTNANKAEFVLLKGQSIVMGSVARQLDAACAGFYSLVPPSALRASKLTPRQLRRLLCGGGDGFDVAQLRQLTVYRAPYSEAHPVVTWLWEVLEEAGRGLQSDFLEFATGASEPPAGGFSAIRGAPLTVAPAPLRSEDGAPGDAPPRLPTARTCAYLFELPPYESKTTLRDKLREALAQKNTFGFA